MPTANRKKKSTSPATGRWRRRAVANALKSPQAKPSQQYPAWAQSLELLKIAVHVTLASILFVRELLPEEAFCDRYLGAVEVGRMYSYDNFLDGHQGTPLAGRTVSARAKKFTAAANVATPHASSYAWVKMIQKGTGEVADQIRDCMQEIWNGIARRQLDALTLCVRAGFDADDSSFPLLETYTMRFSYGGERGHASELDGTIENILRPRSLRSIQRHIHGLSRKLTMLKNASAPPSDRELGIFVMYNEDSALRTARFEFSSSPPDNDRNGIRASEFDQNWEEVIRAGGIIDTGYHNTDFTISHYRRRSMVLYRPSPDITEEPNTRRVPPWTAAGPEWSSQFTEGFLTLCLCHFICIDDCPHMIAK